MSEKTQERLLETLLQEYFPRDSVQVMEDVRSARNHASRVDETEANHILASLTAAPTR